MKKKVLSFAVLMLGLAACQDSDVVKNITPIKTGDEIQFGVSQGFVGINDVDNPGSRTSYGLWANRDQNDKSYPIYWVNGDQISIYCPQASAPVPKHEVDYVLTPNASDSTIGTIVRLDTEEVGLQWGTEDTHHFYGFYPTSAKEGIILDDEGKPTRKLKLNLPVMQAPDTIEYVKDAVMPNGDVCNAYMVRPNMDYCYMYAHNIVSKQALAEENGQVSMTFYPLVTTLEVIVHGPAEGSGVTSLDVSQVVIRSAAPICGDFSLEITESTKEFEGSKFDETDVDDLIKYDGHTEDLDDGTLSNQITIPTYMKDSEGIERPITLKSGEAIVVRAFMLPFNEVNTTETTTAVSVQIAGSGTKTKILNTGTIEKHCMNITQLPALEQPSGNFWMTLLDKNTYFSQLSIPGGHNSYDIKTSPNSANPNGSTTNGIMDFYQSLSIEDQLKAGARAFSFVVGYPAPYYSGAKYNEPQLSGANYDVGDALKNWNNSYELYNFPGGVIGTDKLTDILKYYADALTNLNKEYNDTYSGKTGRTAQECIVLNLCFQQRLESGTNNVVRYAEIARWTKEVDRIIETLAKDNDYKDVFTNDIDKDATLGDLAGHVVVFVTVQTPSFPQSTDSFWSLSGYSSGNFNYKPTESALHYIAMCPATDISGTDISTKHAAMNDRDYDYLFGMKPYGNGVGDNLTVWRQELQRLSYPGTGGGNNVSSYSSRTADKKKLVKELFAKAFSNNSAGITTNWYINNLGGFCVTDNSDSYGSTAGWGGNTVMAAHEINKDAYEFLVNTTNNFAPCGIVLMNFFGADKLTGVGGEVEVYGKLLPQIIIENNYRFALRTRPETTDDSGTTSTQRARSASSNGWDY